MTNARSIFLSLLALSGCSPSGTGASPATKIEVDGGDAAGETSDAAVADADAPSCPSRPKASCTGGCVYDEGVRVDTVRKCFDSGAKLGLCLTFAPSTGDVKCRVRISDGGMYKFGHLMVPSSEFSDWRECTAAEREVFNGAVTTGDCSG